MMRGYRFRRWLDRVGCVMRRVIGAPDYAAYVAHLRACHPGEVPVSESVFLARRLDARYNSPGSRCC